MTARRLVPLTTVLLALAPAVAQAQVPAPPVPPPPTPVPPVPPPPPPAPAPVAGKASFSLGGGLPSGKVRYYAPRQEVRLRGSVKPAVAGEVVSLRVIRRGKMRKRIRSSVQADGRF
jgi:hypothetical protein